MPRVKREKPAPISYNDYLQEVLEEEVVEDDILNDDSSTYFQNVTTDGITPSDETLAISTLTAATSHRKLPEAHMSPHPPHHDKQPQQPSSPPKTKHLQQIFSPQQPGDIGFVAKLVKQRESLERKFASSREKEEMVMLERRRLSAERATLASELSVNPSDDLSPPLAENNENNNDSIDAEIDMMKNRLHLQKIRANIKVIPQLAGDDASSFKENLDSILDLATYENILSPKVKQGDVFNTIGHSMIVNLLQSGVSSICYAVGAERSGKMYTMFGGDDESNYEEALGLIPRVTIHLMANIGEVGGLKMSAVEVGSADGDGFVFRDLLER